MRSNLTCASPNETPYYMYSSCVFPPICYHCWTQDTDTEDGQYPICNDCVVSQRQLCKNGRMFKAPEQRSRKNENKQFTYKRIDVFFI